MTRFVSLSLGALLLVSGALNGCDDPTPEEECETIQAELVESKKECMGAAQMAECVSCYDECDNACGVVDNACPMRFLCPED